MTLLKDPVVLICSGILLLGFVGLLWALSRLFVKKPKAIALDELGLPPEETASAADFRDPLLSRPAPEPVAPRAGSPASREVAERLESMAARLAEMQGVLNRQAGAAPAAGIGQGFSPETVDKLLRIVGNVVQQVDILQKSLNVPRDESTPPPTA